MESLRGHLLIATPGLSSPLFSRSVILMLDHSDQGAMGVILNQPIETRITELAGKVFEDDFEWDKPIYLGGPVPGSLLVIHRLEALGDVAIVPGVFVTLDASRVQQLIRQRPEPSLVIANYSGWGPGQLEGEFDRDSWISIPATSGHVLAPDSSELWRRATHEANARKLSELLHVKSVPLDPSLN